MRQRTWIAIVGTVAVVATLAGLWLWSWPPEVPPFEERPVLVLPMVGGPERPEAEISGLAWRGDELVIVPQYPRRFAEGGGAVFVLERRTVEAAIERGGSLEPRRVPFEAAGLDEVTGFDGLEALAFAGDDVYATIETRAHGDRSTVSYLLKGRAEGRPLARVVLDVSSRVPLPAQTDLANMGYETVLVAGERVVAIYEVNGEINPSPRVAVFDRALQPIGELPMPPIEYRVTDATEPDEEGRFWVANYHWPGSPWQPGVCELTERHGQGASHRRCATVERLVELRLTEGGVEPTETPPILFELIDDAHARNWEGVVRLGDRGFLVVTDEHPASLLAFVRR